MNILFHCTFSDQAEWLKSLKKKFKGHNFFTIKDKVNYSNISVAVIWNLPNNIYKKLVNVRLIFSLGAGVDHIINLPSYNGIPIIRIKDPSSFIVNHKIICTTTSAAHNHRETCCHCFVNH